MVGHGRARDVHGAAGCFIEKKGKKIQSSHVTLALANEVADVSATEPP